MNNNLITYPDLIQYYKKNGDPIYFSAITLKKMKEERIFPFAQEICDFINYRGVEKPLESYSKRCAFLNKLQENFEIKNSYEVSSYNDIKPIERESYNLALLLSFLTTNHRFEILDSFTKFLKLDQKEPCTLLFIGIGTGYEVKLAYDYLNNCEIKAYDSSLESIEYSKDLLAFFNCPLHCLCSDSFPLEAKESLDVYNEKYDKIIICELLEHLEQPNLALLNLKKFLAPKGKMYLTMAINIAQEDHIYHYSKISQARNQVMFCGYKIISELISPVAFLPFSEKDREKIFKRGNYICVVSKE